MKIKDVLPLIKDDFIIFYGNKRLHYDYDDRDKSIKLNRVRSWDGQEIETFFDHDIVQITTKAESQYSYDADILVAIEIATQ